MLILMQESDSESSLSFGGCDILLIGRVIDERGNAAVDFLRKKAMDSYSIEYNDKDYEIEIDGSRINAERMEEFLYQFRGKSIALEATTLGFVEIFLCCRAFYNLDFHNVNILYVEPKRYRSSRRFQLLHKREFELSEEFPGYRAIPGATIRLNDVQKQKGVFFLGYEERRLDRALEDYPMIQPTNCCVIFGVPAFKPGWEMDAFANNIRVIRDKNIRGGIYYCGAENPAATVMLLENIYTSLDHNERMFVAPIGTKPMGIGTALFVSAHKDIGILYDHPKRRAGRTEEISGWHIYNVKFNNNL